MNRVRVRKHAPGVYVGSLTLGCPGASGVGDDDGMAVITVGAFGSSQADSLHKAALIAERIANDPIMRAILPPQAAAAIAATKKLASAAQHGSRIFRSVWKRIRGPGIRRVARALHDEAMKREGHSDAQVAGFWSRAKKVAKKAAKYGTVPGLVYTAAKAAKRKLSRKRPPQMTSPEEIYADDNAPEAPDVPPSPPSPPPYDPNAYDEGPPQAPEEPDWSDDDPSADDNGGES